MQPLSVNHPKFCELSSLSRFSGLWPELGQKQVGRGQDGSRDGVYACVGHNTCFATYEKRHHIFKDIEEVHFQQRNDAGTRSP